jgi:hypothetical protein
MIVFALSGLWHGAAWHFVAWGILHGIFQVAERFGSKTFNVQFPKNAITKPIQVIVTFVFVCIAWIFFRADSLASAVGICGKLLALPRELAGYIQGISQIGIVETVSQMFSLGNGLDEVSIPAFGRIAFGLSIIFITCLAAAEILTRKEIGTTRIMKMPLVVRWTGYVTVILILIFTQTKSSEFIYFTF